MITENVFNAVIIKSLCVISNVLVSLEVKMEHMHLIVIVKNRNKV